MTLETGQNQEDKATGGEKFDNVQSDGMEEKKAQERWDRRMNKKEIKSSVSAERG